MLDRLHDLRDLVYNSDVPHPTIPEYVELHNKIQAILQELDSIIDEHKSARHGKGSKYEEYYNRTLGGTRR